MERARVTLRPTTEAEYAAYVGQVQAEVVRGLRATVSEDEARATAARQIAEHLPAGRATPHHALLVAEDASGTPVGNAWVGPVPNRSVGTAAAWLYDIHVRPDARRKGYGEAILAEVEALVARQGWSRLGLNVHGGNEAALALYGKRGYAVTMLQMAKDVR